MSDKPIHSIVHMCASVRGMLNWDRRYAKRMLPTLRREDGTHFRTVEEFRGALMEELAQGHEVIPAGPCDNFDYKTGCRGHTQKASGEA